MKSVTGRDFCRALSRQGWATVRIQGGHHVMGKAGCPNISIPVHAGKTLKVGLQKALMKQTGLTVADL